MSAGGAERKYKLSQISSPTRRRETSGAAILKESVHRRLMGKVAGSEQLRERGVADWEVQPAGKTPNVDAVSFWSEPAYR